MSGTLTHGRREGGRAPGEMQTQPRVHSKGRWLPAVEGGRQRLCAGLHWATGQLPSELPGGGSERGRPALSRLSVDSITALKVFWPKEY